MDERDLLAIARQQDIDPSTVLHEEREVRFLAGLAEDPVLVTSLAFKGGTALRFVYLCDRYSDDLDFDLVGKEASPADILRRLEAITTKHDWEVTDSWTKRRTILFETRASGWKRRLKIEISRLQRKGKIPTIVRNVVTPVFPASVNVLTYPLSVLLAGKMLAILERPFRAPRDLYDLFWLLSRGAEEDARYFAEAATQTHVRSLARKRIALYRALIDTVDDYTDTSIRTELGALLPAKQRRWATGELKERTRELLELRVHAAKHR